MTAGGLARLDRATSLAQIEAVDVDAAIDELWSAIAAPSPLTFAGVVDLDAALRAAISVVEAFTTKSTRVRLEHALARDTSLGIPFMKLISATASAYAGDLETLRERARSTAVRTDPDRADAAADSVVAAVAAALSQRARLRDGVLALARERAAELLPAVVAAAKDAAKDDKVRLQWSAVRRDLEQVVERPAHLLSAVLTDRIAALPPLLDEPDREPERSFGELIELD